MAKGVIANGVWDVNTLTWVKMQQPVLEGGSVVVSVTGMATEVNQTNGAQKTQIVDGSGNVIGSTGNALDVNLKTPTTLPVSGPLTDTQLRAAAIDTLQNLSVPKHDFISLSYTGSNLTTVVFKTGGSGGVTVATLTLAYSGSTLTSVTKT